MGIPATLHLMSEDVRIHGQLTEFLHELRCEACQQRNGKCILQESDEKCMLCADADRPCIFTATVTVKGQRACFHWKQLLDRAKLPILLLGDLRPSELEEGIRSAFNKPSYAPQSTYFPKPVAPKPADPIIASQTSPPIVIEKWSVVPATAARKNLWRDSVSYDPESGDERPELGYQARRTGRVVKPSSLRRHSPPFQPHVVSAQKETPLSNFSCHVCGMKARNASEWKKHQLRHTKPFVCDITGCARQEGFSTKNDLERHSKSVHNIISNSTLDRNFRCAARDCPKKEKIWLRLDNFRQHCHRIHGEQDTEELIKKSELPSSTELIGPSFGDVSHQMVRQPPIELPRPHKYSKSAAEPPELVKKSLSETEWRMPSINEIVSHAETPRPAQRVTSLSPPVRVDVENSDIAPTSTRSSTISIKPDLKILRPKPDETLPQQDLLSHRSSPLKDTVMRDSNVIVLDSKNDMVEASTRGKRHLTESERQKVAKVRKSGACEECRKSKKRCTHSWIYSEHDGDKHIERSSESSPTSPMARHLSSEPPSDIPKRSQHSLEGISFIISIEALNPKYELEPARVAGHGFWDPPDVCDAFFRGPITAFRWKNGCLSRINVPITTDKVKDCLSCATVFTQSPSTPHMLAVEFDAETKPVKDSPGGWKMLSFDHIKAQDSGAVLSSIELFGSERLIAAPCPAHLRQLLPSVYDWQAELDTEGRRGTKPPIFAGFIGNLPLLIALAAFSAPPSSLEKTLVQCIRPGVWVPHPQDTGHRPERGMVVKVMSDPENPIGSNMSHLERLEQGDYGPFYGPDPYVKIVPRDPTTPVRATSTGRVAKRSHES